MTVDFRKTFKTNTTTFPKTNFIGTNCGLGISFENNIFIGFTGITFPGLDWDQLFEPKRLISI
jgi:hypothetical protein